MNDRFKFRAWNIIVNRYEYFDFHSLAKMDYDKIQWHILKFEQCTGLKDKNGRLIYEGDIVKATFKYTGSNTENLCFAVAFSDGAFGYFDELGRFGLLANFGIAAMFQVVGNIHENPELLEDKK